MQGDSKKMREQMLEEIDSLKKQLAERTGQLEVASNTILARNDEIQRLKAQVEQLTQEHQAKQSQLQAQITDLEAQLEDLRLNGQAG